MHPPLTVTVANPRSDKSITKRFENFKQRLKSSEVQGGFEFRIHNSTPLAGVSHYRHRPASRELVYRLAYESDVVAFKMGHSLHLSIELS